MSLIAALLDRALALAFLAVVAAWHGVGAETDAFFLALAVPTALGGSVAEGIYATSLPLFAAAPHDRDLMRRVLGTTSIACATIIVIYVIAILAWAPQNLVLWLAPASLFIAMPVSAVLAAVLAAERRYAWAALRVPAATTVGLLCLLLSSAFTDSIASAAVAMTTGHVFIAACLAINTRLYFLATWPIHTALAEPAAQASGAALAGGPLLVVAERTMASTLAAGAVASLTFARNLALAPLILPTALANGIFPAASLSFHRDKRYFISIARRAFRLVLVVSLATLAIMISFRADIVRLVLVRGEVGTDDADVIISLIAIIALALPGLATIALTGRIFFAADRYRAAFLVNIILLVTYVLAALVLRVVADLQGIAAALPIAATVAAVVAAALFGRVLEVGTGGVLRDCSLPGAAALIAIGVLLADDLAHISDNRLGRAVVLFALVSVAASAILIDRLTATHAPPVGSADEELPRADTPFSRGGV